MQKDIPLSQCHRGMSGWNPQQYSCKQDFYHGLCYVFFWGDLFSLILDRFLINSCCALKVVRSASSSAPVLCLLDHPAVLFLPSTPVCNQSLPTQNTHTPWPMLLGFWVSSFQLFVLDLFLVVWSQSHPLPVCSHLFPPNALMLLQYLTIWTVFQLCFSASSPHLLSRPHQRLFETSIKHPNS